MDDDARETKDSDRLEDVHKRALRRFDLFLPEMEWREHALLCRRFISIPGAMWDGPWGEQFANSIRVEIDKVSKGVDKLITDYRANRIVPDFRPAGTSGDEETASTLDGMHRADAYHFKAGQAWDHAVEEAASGGFGAWRLANDYADPLDGDNDEQRINPGLIIVDADQRVFFDPEAKAYDKSDARFAFVLTFKTKDALDEEFDDAITTWPEHFNRPGYEWFTPDGAVVAEYYEVDTKREERLVFTHKLTGEEQRHWRSDLTAEDIRQLELDGWSYTRRKRDRRLIRKYVMSGAEVLEDCGPIAGSRIPIVPVYFKRAVVEGVERVRGFVSKLMDAQRIYNAKVSKLAETDALSPREKPIFAPSQMPGNLANMWAEQDINRHPYALAEPLIDEATGQIVSAGPTGQVQAPQVAPITAALLQIASADLAGETDDGADEVMANTSAEAMDIAATRIDARSGIFLDQVRQSVQCSGEIYLGMVPEVYVEPGRKVETMSEDGADGTATLAEPVIDKRNGEYKLRNDFGNGRYKVIVDVTEATATRRDKTVKQMLNLASVSIQAQDIEGAQAAIITAGLNMDGEGMDDFSKWNRKRAVQMGLVEPSDEEKAEMEQAAQQPDPTSVLAEAQGKALEASAVKDMAQAQESESKIALNEARALQAAAKAKSDAEQPSLMQRTLGKLGFGRQQETTIP